MKEKNEMDNDGNLYESDWDFSFLKSNCPNYQHENLYFLDISLSYNVQWVINNKKELSKVNWFF